MSRTDASSQRLRILLKQVESCCLEVVAAEVATLPMLEVVAAETADMGRLGHSTVWWLTRTN